jgi:predicted nucleic acid-binding protein
MILKELVARADELGAGWWDEFEKTLRETRMKVRIYTMPKPTERDDADLLIAAYTSHLRAILVTNNTHDFSDLEVPLVDRLA